MTTQTYTDAQQRCIDEHRDINVDYDWWDSTFEHFTELTGEIGLDVHADDIQFSGFWSQGDGASFTFSSYSLATILDKCEAFLAKHEALAEEHRKALEEQQLYKEILATASDIVSKFQKYRLCGGTFMDDVMGNITLVAERTSHHYSHSRTVTAHWDASSVVGFDADTRLHSLWLQLEKELDDEWADSTVEDIANALYRSLEEEYEYQTTDDAVWEMIEANDLFKEDEEDEEEEACAA